MLEGKPDNQAEGCGAAKQYNQGGIWSTLERKERYRRIYSSCLEKVNSLQKH